MKHLRLLIQACRLRAKKGLPRCEGTIDTENIVNHTGRQGVFRCLFTFGHELIPNGLDDRPSHFHPEIGNWW